MAVINEKKIKELRLYLEELLQQYNGEEKIKLNLGELPIEELLFKYTTPTRKDFALSYEQLIKLDLTGVSFDDFDASKEDFTEMYGVSINPQTLFSKDLRDSILCGVTLIGSLEDCKVSGANFAGCNGAIVNPASVYDSNWIDTTCTDVTFTSPFDRCYVGNTNFEGSNGAVINVETLARKDLEKCILDGVEFVGEITSCNLSNSKFKGSKNAVINVETIDDDKLVGAELEDATVYGSWTGKDLFGINFRGCKGNVEINPQLTKDKGLRYAKFAGVTFTGPFDDCDVKKSDFTGSRGAVMVSEEIRNMDTANLTDVHVIPNVYEIAKERIADAFAKVKKM